MGINFLLQPKPFNNIQWFLHNIDTIEGPGCEIWAGPGVWYLGQVYPKLLEDLQIWGYLVHNDEPSQMAPGLGEASRF